MPTLERPVARRRPVYLNLLAIRQPMPAVVSILHRISGALLFLAGIPLLLWAVDASLGSPEVYGALAHAMGHPLAKLTGLALLWATLHHVFAGIRYLMIDVHVMDDLPGARRSAAFVLVASLLLTVILAVRLW
jgi:succinate dehydrogenase / fumarate reductase, cytochrome b subunit